MRVKTGFVRHRKHKKILESTSGYRMTRNRLFKVAHEALWHAGSYAYIGRKNRKRDFRTLWIARISAALDAVAMQLNYSRFIAALNHAKIMLNRKSLAELAVYDLDTFGEVVKLAKKV
jgi:large subunit ribosomal protein L20